MPYNPAKDHYNGNLNADRSAPATLVAAVTPTDGADLATYAKALYIGVTGDVTVIPVDGVDGATVTFKAHPVGYMPCRVRQVYATGTTATNILALYD